jgi:hypothetical protein
MFMITHKNFSRCYRSKPKLVNILCPIAKINNKDLITIGSMHMKEIKFSSNTVSPVPCRHTVFGFINHLLLRTGLGILFFLPLGLFAQFEDQPSPLRGLKSLILKINEMDSDPTIDMVIRENIRHGLTESLQQAGLIIVDPAYADYMPELEISKRVVSINNFSIASITIELNQMADVLRYPEKNTTQRVVTWKRATMGLFPVQSSDQIVRGIGQHIDGFIKEYIAANQEPAPDQVENPPPDALSSPAPTSPLSSSSQRMADNPPSVKSPSTQSPPAPTHIDLGYGPFPFTPGQSLPNAGNSATPERVAPRP